MKAHIRFRPRITRKTCFFLPNARIELLTIFDFFLFNLIDKKNITKKSSSFQDIKNFFPAMFFLLIFLVALVNFI